MKILICYHSLTGNTEKVVKAIKEALVGQDITISRAIEVSPTSKR